MSELPQPADRRQLRVSDADREQAAEVLRQAAGDGRITFEELDQRLEAAYAARTYGDLTEVTADLPAPGQPPPGPLATAAPGTFPAARIGGEPGSGMSVAILGGVDRGGTWVVPPRHSVVAVLGGVQLDLREARFSQREVTIDVFTLMGGVDIMVGDDEGVTVIPQHIAEEVAEEAFEQTAFEDFVQQKVAQGRSIFGIYPPGPEAREEFKRWRAAKGR